MTEFIFYLYLKFILDSTKQNNIFPHIQNPGTKPGFPFELRILSLLGKASSLYFSYDHI